MHVCDKEVRRACRSPGKVLNRVLRRMHLFYSLLFCPPLSLICIVHRSHVSLIAHTPVLGLMSYVRPAPRR